MSTLPATADTDDDLSGGLSHAALTVFVCPDMIGFWRLRKSLALDDARWYFDADRKVEAAQMAAAGRSCHREIMAILRFLRTGVRSKESLRFAQSFRLEGALPRGPKAPPTPASAPHPIFDRTPAVAVEPPKPPKLTPREKEIARLLGENLRVTEIARRIKTSMGNVSVHIIQARMKLGLADRHELGKLAREKPSMFEAA